MTTPFRSELRELFRLAAPIAAAQAGTQLMSIVDVAVLGRVSPVALAASGLANVLFFGISVVGIGLVYGVDPMISQAIGSGSAAAARRALWQGVWLALLTSVVLMIPLLVAPLLLPLAGVQPELIRPASQFLVIRSFSLPPFLLFLVARAYLQAHGKTFALVFAMVAANVLNFLGDLLFVFGGASLPWWSGPLRAVPAMGVPGAALATLLCTILEVVIVAIAIRRIPVPEHDEPLHQWNAREVNAAFRVGLPVGLQFGAEIGVFALVGVLAGRLGTNDLAAHQLVISLASFTYTLALGVAAAGSVRVGLAVGALDPPRTRLAGRAAFTGGALVMAVNAAAFAFLPGPLVRTISNQASVIAVALPLMLVAAVFQLSDGIQAVGAGVLRGAADTRYAFVANLLGHWLIGLPISIYLGFHKRMGIVGLWWGLCAGLTIVAVLLFLRFHKLSAKPIVPIAQT